MGALQDPENPLQKPEKTAGHSVFREKEKSSHSHSGAGFDAGDSGVNILCPQTASAKGRKSLSSRFVLHSPFQGKPPPMHGRFLSRLSYTLALLVLSCALETIACREPVVPGGDWKDDRGKIVAATEGGVVQVDGIWYLWGMDRSANNSAFVGINLYKSTDLVHWNFVKQILRHDSDPSLDNNAVVERAKILRNPRTGKYVMWMHYEGHNAYSVAEVAWATADKIDGDYKFQGHFRPLDLDSRDLNVYQDDDGKAYLICTTKGNQNVSLFLLDTSYTKIVSEVYRGSASNDMECEGHAIVKSAGTYYWMMSWCSGWDFNDNRYFTAKSLAGPWSTGKGVAPSGTHTYESQVGWAFPMPGNDGTNFVYMGDRWSVNDFSLSRLVMLPFTVSAGTLAVQWFDRWYPDADSGWLRGEPLLPEGIYTVRSRATGKVLAVPSKASAAKAWLVTDSGTASQRWKLVDLGDSEYALESVLTGLRLEINGASRDTGAAAIQYAANGGMNQKWHLVRSSPLAWRLVNENTLGKVLQVAAGSKSEGAGAVLGAYKWAAHQEWEIAPVVPLVEGKSYVFEASHSGKALTTSSTGMEQWTDSVKPTQVWRALSSGGGMWAFEQAGKRLGVVGDSVVDGAGLGLVSDTGSGAKWIVADDGTGLLRIVNGCSGKTLDVNGGEKGTADGAKVQQWRDWATRNQRWTAREVKAVGNLDGRRGTTSGQMEIRGRELRIANPGSWTRVELRGLDGRNLSILPALDRQILPASIHGLVGIRLEGRGSREIGFAVLP